MRLLIHIFAAAALFSVLTGCGLKSKDDASHPLFKRAVKAQESNELDLAVSYFNRYLAMKPDSSVTHLRLASIYDENLDQPLRAVYHYERFLEFTPNSPEAGNVKKWRDAALRKYYFRTRRKFNDPEDVSVLQNSLYLAEQELKKNKVELEKIKDIQKQLIQFAREKRDSEKILQVRLKSLQAAHKQTLEEMNELREKLKKQSVPQENKKEEEKKTEKQEEKDAKKEDKKDAAEKQPDTKNVELVKAEEEKKPIEKMKAEEENKPVEPEKKVEKPEEKTVKPIEKKAEKTEGKENGALPVIPNAAPAAPPFPAKVTDKPAAETVSPEIKNDKPEVKADAAELTYTVERGDSLSSISRKFYGSSRYYRIIFEANRDIIPSEKALRPGQVLKIPRR